MIKKILLLSIFVLSTILVLGQTVRIKGTVTDKRNNPLPYVSVSLKDKSRAIGSTVTSSNGSYSIETHTRDSIHVLFSSVGYQTIDLKLSRVTNDVELSVVMTDEEHDLKEVTVSAVNPTRTINMTLDVFDASRRSYLLDSSIESLLASLPGVSSTNELSSQYQVRGGNFDENIIYVNGTEIYRPMLVRSGQQEGLSFINPSMVQTVAFSTGGYGAEYGDKMSSVLDVYYKRPSRFEGSVGASLMDGSVYIGNSTKRFSQITSVRYKSTESLLGTTDTDAEYKPSFLDVQSFMTFDLSPKWQISLLANVANNKYEFVPKTRSTNFGTLANVRTFKVYFDGWENDKFLTYQSALSIKGQINDNLELSFTGSAFSSTEQERYDITGKYRLTEFEGEEVNSQAGDLLGVGSYHEHARNKLEVDVMNASHSGKFKLSNHLIKWGLSLQHERIKDKIREWEMRDSTGYLLPSNGNGIDMYSSLKSNNKLNSNRFSGYLQDRYLLNTDFGLFSFNAGVRASYWDYNEEFLISPRAAVIFIPDANNNLTFRLAGGLYYQAPFYKEYQQPLKDSNDNSVIKPNENIKSQRSVHVVLGTDFLFKVIERPFKFTSEVYYKSLSNLIPYTVDNVKIRYSGLNEGKGYITGLDLRLFGEFVPNTSSWIGFSLMKTQQNVNGVKSPLPTDQRYSISGYFQDYFPGYERLKMNLKGVYSDGLPFVAPHSTISDGHFRHSAYKRVDLGFSWEMLGEHYAIRKKSSFCKTFKNIWLGLDVFNLFDMQNVNTYYWVSDVYSNQYGVPNYLTGRQLNVRLLAEF